MALAQISVPKQVGPFWGLYPPPENPVPWGSVPHPGQTPISTTANSQTNYFVNDQPATLDEFNAFGASHPPSAYVGGVQVPMFSNQEDLSAYLTGQGFSQENGQWIKHGPVGMSMSSSNTQNPTPVVQNWSPQSGAPAPDWAQPYLPGAANPTPPTPSLPNYSQAAGTPSAPVWGGTESRQAARLQTSSGSNSFFPRWWQPQFTSNSRLRDYSL